MVLNTPTLHTPGGGIEQVAVVSPVGHELRHQRPETLVVMTFQQGHHLVHQHMFQTLGRFLYQLQVEPDAVGLALWQFPILILIYAAAYFTVNYLIKHQAHTLMLVSAFIPLMLLPFAPSPEKMALASGIATILVVRMVNDFYLQTKNK